LEKRFKSYETIGALFRENQHEMLEQTITERIMYVVMEIIIELMDFLTIDIKETLRNMMADEKATEKLLATLIAVNQLNTTKLTKINAA
jgi:hypothetical protein